MAEVVTNHEVAGMREQHSFHNIRSSQLERERGFGGIVARIGQNRVL